MKNLLHKDQKARWAHERREASNAKQISTSIIPGLAAAVLVASLATIAGQQAPIVGPPVFAIVGGIVFTTLWKMPTSTKAGLSFSSKHVLQGSIVVLGTQLSFRQVIATGVSSLPVLLGTLAVALVGAYYFGKLLGISNDLRTLIGVGTGICGASAIAATDAVISASEIDVSYAIATIFTFNVLAVLTFPSIGHLLAMTPHAFGLWSGTAVNDMSSVVAAASIFSGAAISYAIVVKLTRTLMIIPITLILAFWRSRSSSLVRTTGEHKKTLRKIGKVLPVFIGWFLAAVTLNTLGLIPAGAHELLSTTAQFMITIALAAIGLSTRIDQIRSAGLRPIALGAILWIMVAFASIALQVATGTL